MGVVVGCGVRGTGAVVGDVLGRGRAAGDLWRCVGWEAGGQVPAAMSLVALLAFGRAWAPGGTFGHWLSCAALPMSDCAAPSAPQSFALQKFDSLLKEVQRLTTITNDLLGDMQEAANDVSAQHLAAHSPWWHAGP